MNRRRCGLALLIVVWAIGFGTALAKHEEIAPQPLVLTAEQRALLAQHPTLRLGVESNWAPIEFFDERGVYSGVISSYMRAVESQLGIRFELVRKNSWAEVLDAFGRGEVDVLSALSEGPAHADTMQFSDAYVQLTNGIIVRNDEPYVERLKDFPAGKRLAAVQGYRSSERAAALNPKLVVVPVRTAEEALAAVSTGRADLAVASLASAYWQTQLRGLSNLRVAANYDESEQSMSIAVRPELSGLLPIFNLALANISPGERQNMRARWTDVALDRGVARSSVVFWSAVAVGGLLLLGGWVAWLLSQQKRRQRLLLRAEAAEQQFRAMLDVLPAVFWILRTDKGAQSSFQFFGNSETSRQIGFRSNDEMHNFEQAAKGLLPEDAERIRQLLAHHGSTMTAFNLEHRVVVNGVAKSWAYTQGVPRRENGSLVWYGCIVDITQRKQLEAALERSRNQLEELAAGVPGALWQFKRESNGEQSYSYMSDGITTITGRTPEETNQLMKEKSFTSVHPDDLHIVQGLMQRLTGQPGIDEARYRLHTADGGWKWVQVAARAMPIGPDGTLVWNGITLDATRLQETEQALRLERQRLKDITENLSGVVWRMRRGDDGSLKFDYLSENAEAIAGRSTTEILANNQLPLDAIEPEDRARVLAAIETAIKEIQPLDVEYSARSSNGAVLRLHSRAAVRVEDGQPVWTGMLFNVSERYRLEQTLADVRDRLEDIAANFPGAIFQMHRDPEGHIRYTYVSEGITALTGRPPRTRDGREVLEDDLINIHPDDRQRLQEINAQLVRDGGSMQFDYRLLDVQGQPHWVHCAVSSRRQADGSIISNGLLLDAEKAKHLEADLRSASERAEAASRAKSQFLANMSHEIRTPMNAVIGLAYLAMTSATDPAQAERIGKIHKAGKALLKLLNDILEYSRLDAGKFTPVLAAFDLHEISDGLRLFCLPVAEAKGLHFEIDYAADTPMHWLGDATRIQQVLLNLITNAIKFTDSGKVILTIRPAPERSTGLVFEVRDTGIGMTPEQIQRVFAPFEQASGEIERRHGGSGLGLSICQALVQALGGTLKVFSTLGMGTVFTVSLPLQAAASPAPLIRLIDGELEQRLNRLGGHLAQRDTGAVRNSVMALRLLLLPQGREPELHTLERLLAHFDFEAAELELSRLRMRWTTPGR